MSAVGRFVEELRRRRVFRVGAIYAVTAFAAFQVVDVVFPALHLPEWTVTLTVVAGLLGYPVTLVLAWFLDLTPEGLRRTPPPERPLAEPTARFRVRRIGLAAALSVAAIGLILLGAWLALGRQEVRRVAATLDPNTIAVLPFRIGGASPDLAYLHEGMVDLLYTTLFTADGIHAVDAPSVVRAWRQSTPSGVESPPIDSVLEIARGLGASWTLVGSVVGVADRVTLSGELIETASGRVRARPRVEGAADTLTGLVDRMAGQLLARIAGETEERTSLLAGVPLSAIRAYLEGREEARHGRYPEAFARYGDALRIDSTFVPAGLGMIEAGGWDAGTPAELTRARALVARHMDDLPPGERLLALAYIGPRYPEPVSGAEMLEYARQLHEARPYNPESGWRLAEGLFHSGASLDATHADRRSRELFTAILEADSTNAGALEHLAELALSQGDTITVRRLTRRYRSLDPERFKGHVMEWYGLLAAADTSGIADYRARMPQMSSGTLWGITSVGRLLGIDLQTVDRAADELAERGSWSGYLAAWSVNASRGRPTRVREALQTGRRTQPRLASAFDVLAIIQALYGDGDPADAHRAAERLEADAAEVEIGRTALCVLEQWRLWNGSIDRAATTIETLSTAAPDSVNWSHVGARFCALIVETVLAHVTDRADAPGLVERLDSAAATDPAATSHIIVAVANRVVSHLFEEAEDPVRALRAARRQAEFGGSLPFLTARLLDQARLAERTGDRAAAIQALRHYIILRSGAEAPGLPALEQARRDLARLSGIEDT